VNLLLGMGALGSESEPEISENIFWACGGVFTKQDKYASLEGVNLLLRLRILCSESESEISEKLLV
jgi:hypothetical protein